MRGDELNRAYAAIVDDARSQVAAGNEPDAQAFAARIRAATTRAGSPGTKEEQRALQQLERVLSIHRARTRVAREPAPPPPVAAVPRRTRVLRTKPTISGNMEVRRQKGGGTNLAWDRASRVVTWEVRFSERVDSRVDYAVRETRELPGETTSVEVALGDHPVRVHLLGRGRDGRLLSRAIISGLTPETWSEKWQRRATAS